MNEHDYALFVSRVKQKTGIDLAQYKEKQMKRRLTTLRNKNRFHTFADFFDAISRNEQLYNEFMDRLTINVTEFWRNPDRWKVLEERIIPQLIRTSGRLKVWSAACSTGEEPYTLAMILAEQGALNRTELLATDLDENALAKAREGRYPERAIRDVPDRYLQSYFHEELGQYRISADLKRSVSFRRHNLLADRFEMNFDLIVCRNVMIYFTDTAKHELYGKFAASLKPGGFLFVGSSEQIFSPKQYGLESAETFFYRKTADIPPQKRISASINCNTENTANKVEVDYG
jgi:chemotaxis protein methyltransferase CheR